MEKANLFAVFFYMLSTGGYILYLFFQKDYLQRIGFHLMAIGFATHSLAIAISFGRSGHIPVSNLYETLSIAAWAVAAVFLILHHRYNLKILGIYAAPLVTFTMLAAIQLPRGAGQPQNIFKSLWLMAHIVAIFIGEASFALACGVGMLYLLQEHAIKNKNHGFFYRRLPSLGLLDTTGYACIIAGFTMLTIGLITGFVYAKSLWGRFWSWDPKEVCSGIAWLLYAGLLHGRLAVGWRGRQAAIMAIVGFAVLLFTFLGVNFLMEGHHREFTRW